MPESPSVGIDVCKAHLDVAASDSTEEWRFANDGEGIEGLAKQVARLKPVVIVLEATGGYEIEIDHLERIGDAIPDAAITTDVIVGFPGETEADFQDTLEVVRQVQIERAIGAGDEVLIRERGSRIHVRVDGKRLRSGQLTGNVDVAPTLLAVAGVTVPAIIPSSATPSRCASAPRCPLPSWRSGSSRR